MKPDWKDSPPWATHLAMDSDGQWHWHSKKPKLHSTFWFPYGKNVRTKLAGRSEPEWENSLEQRPNNLVDASKMIGSIKPKDEVRLIFNEPEPQEILRIDKDGFHYKGVTVDDAGGAYRMFMDFMEMSQGGGGE